MAINKEKNEAKALAEKITTALSDKKAHDIDVIDMEKVSILSDYFVICSGTSTTHIKSLADEVDFVLSKDNIEPLHREGMSTARWILLDYGSVIVHIFHEEERQYYSLERLWSDGKITRKA
ncbi:MAG: ribosome silencing factor [Bacillota bacterium]